MMSYDTLNSRFYSNAANTGSYESGSTKPVKVRVTDPNLAVPEAEETEQTVLPKPQVNAASLPKPQAVAAFSSQALLNQGKMPESRDGGPSAGFLKALSGNIDFVSLAGGGSHQAA